MIKYFQLLHVYYLTFSLDALLKGSRKKVLLLMTRPLRPNPPSSSLMAVGTLEKKVQKKVPFPLMARPLREELFLWLP